LTVRKLRNGAVMDKEFVVVVTGDRNWTDYERIKHVLSAVKPTRVIAGGARGADKLAERACDELGIPCDVYPAEWKKFGRAAGPIRNRQMLDLKPDHVLAFHDDLNSSKGTKDCTQEATRRGIPVGLWRSEGGVIEV
jgi:hypothetical protein